MFVRLFALPIALQLVSAGGVPEFDVTPSCVAIAEAGRVASMPEILQSCVHREHRARNKLRKNWSSFPAADRGGMRLLDHRV